MASNTVYLTQKFHLNCSHLIKSCDEHKQNFSKETSFHGHSLELYITLKTQPNKDSGLIINRDILNKTIQETVLNKYHNKNLNNLFAIPTGENLMMSIHNDLLNSPLCGIYFQSQLKETAKNFFSSPLNPSSQEV